MNEPSGDAQDRTELELLRSLRKFVEADDAESVRVVLGELFLFDDDRELYTRIYGREVLPEHLRGDGPCQDCGTVDNIVWFTESVLWNEVMAAVPGSGILCIPCFVVRVNRAGLAPTGYRLLPDWHWESVEEKAARGATAAASSAASAPSGP